MLPLRLALVVLFCLLCGCRALHGSEPASGSWIAVDTASGHEVGLDDMADRLAACDVVFLGELHDQDVGHALQLALTERIVARRPNASLSFEMIERDAQPLLDRYLAGEISESAFLDGSRPWGNYREHYSPLVEFAKARGLPVIAANVPRPLASRVSKGGMAAVSGEAFVPRSVIAPPGEYRRRFAEAMGKPADSEDPGLALWFLAQCVKDEAMAESIELALCAPPPGRIVLHYCGQFHSNFRLGTVERLLRRQPSLKVGIVSMSPGERSAKRVDAELARTADFVLLVAP